MQSRIDNLTWRLHSARAFAGKLLAEKHEGKWDQAEAEMTAAPSESGAAEDHMRFRLGEAESLLRRCARQINSTAENPGDADRQTSELLADIYRHFGEKE